MKIYLGSDHAGFELKEAIKEHLIKKGYIIEDLGTHSNERANYADYGHSVGKAVSKNPEVDKGVIICGTGIGISIAANRHPNVRAARCTSVDDAMITRMHNDANILAMGERSTKKELALKMVDIFFETKFEGGRHIDRIKSIEC
jgi:ribose 5-phosphate isomerase B